MKWRETKQQPSMLPGPAVPGCCLVSFCSLCDIHSIHRIIHISFFRHCIFGRIHSFHWRWWRMSSSMAPHSHLHQQIQKGKIHCPTLLHRGVCFVFRNNLLSFYWFTLEVEHRYRSWEMFCKMFSESSPGRWAVLQLPCCPSKEGELSENIIQNLSHDLMNNLVQ